MKRDESDDATSDTLEMNDDDTQPLSPVYGSCVQQKFCMFAEDGSTNIIAGDSPAKLVQKRRCFRDLRPAYYAPDPKDRIAQAALNLHNFNHFSTLLRQAQDLVLKRVPWGEPVDVGRHMSRTIDYKARGMKSFVSVERSDEENNDEEINRKRNGTPLKSNGENSKKPRHVTLAPETQDFDLDIKDSEAESVPETQIFAEENQPLEKKGAARKRKMQRIQTVQSLFSTESSDENEVFVSLLAKRKRKSKVKKSPLKEVNENLNGKTLPSKDEKEKAVIVVSDDEQTPVKDHDSQKVKEPEEEVKSKEEVTTKQEINRRSSTELPAFPNSPSPMKFKQISRLSRKTKKTELKPIDQKVSCPLCDEMFEVDLIQRHAADCDGKPPSPQSADSMFIPQPSTAASTSGQRSSDVPSTQKTEVSHTSSDHPSPSNSLSELPQNADNPVLPCPMCHSEVASDKYEKHVISCVNESETRREEESRDDKRVRRSERNPDDQQQLRKKTSRKRRL